MCNGTIYTVDTLAWNLSQSWLIERIVHNDKEDITVKELGQRTRETYEREMSRHWESEVDQTYHSIWPHKDDTKDWRVNRLLSFLRFRVPVYLILNLYYNYDL